MHTLAYGLGRGVSRRRIKPRITLKTSVRARRSQTTEKRLQNTSLARPHEGLTSADRTDPPARDWWKKHKQPFGGAKLSRNRIQLKGEMSTHEWTVGSTQKSILKIYDYHYRASDAERDVRSLAKGVLVGRESRRKHTYVREPQFLSCQSVKRSRDSSVRGSAGLGDRAGTGSLERL